MNEVCIMLVQFMNEVGIILVQFMNVGRRHGCGGRLGSDPAARL